MQKIQNSYYENMLYLAKVMYSLDILSNKELSNNKQTFIKNNSPIHVVDEQINLVLTKVR